MILVGIITSILLFSIIVIIHEFGHFFTARYFGVEVEEFGVGIPPRAKKIFTDKKGTLFTLNWFPLGGFVKLKGQNGELLEDKSDPHAFINISSYKQAIIILGGVFMNFVLAAVILSILFLVGTKPIGINTAIETNRHIRLIPTYQQAIDMGFLIKNPGVILSPVQDGIAEKAGIQAGDILLKINTQTIEDPNTMMQIISDSSGKKITFTLQDTQKKVRTLSITPSKDGKIGSYISKNISINKDFEYQYSLIDSVKYGIGETYQQSLLTLKGLGIISKKIFAPQKQNDRQEAISQISGPIGIVDFITNSLKGGVVSLFIIAALISINLGIFNLLPIPALDGGRFLLIIINGIIKGIFGKKALSENTESIIHTGFFIVLIALSVLIMYNDIYKIISH